MTGFPFCAIFRAEKRVKRSLEVFQAGSFGSVAQGSPTWATPSANCLLDCFFKLRLSDSIIQKKNSSRCFSFFLKNLLKLHFAASRVKFKKISQKFLPMQINLGSRFKLFWWMDDQSNKKICFCEFNYPRLKIKKTLMEKNDQKPDLDLIAKLNCCHWNERRTGFNCHWCDFDNDGQLAGVLDA